MNVGCAGKTVISLENACRAYMNPHLFLPLPFHYGFLEFTQWLKFASVEIQAGRWTQNFKFLFTRHNTAIDCSILL